MENKSYIFWGYGWFILAFLWFFKENATMGYLCFAMSTIYFLAHSIMNELYEIKKLLEK